MLVFLIDLSAVSFLDELKAYRSLFYWIGLLAKSVKRAELFGFLFFDLELNHGSCDWWEV